MKNGDVIVFKRYSDYSFKKLFKMSTDPDGRWFQEMNKIRNRLIHRRQNVGSIYVLYQGTHGPILERYPNGIPFNRYDEKSDYIDIDELDYIIKIAKRNKIRNTDWFKIRK